MHDRPIHALLPFYASLFHLMDSNIHHRGLCRLFSYQDFPPKYCYQRRNLCQHIEEGLES